MYMYPNKLKIAVGFFTCILWHHMIVSNVPTYIMYVCMMFSFFFHRVNWVIWNGSTYKSPCVLVIGCDEYPVFGQLHAVYVVNNFSCSGLRVL